MNIELIEKTMKEKDFTNASLARAMGTTNHTLVRDILIGKSENPRIDTITTLAACLDLNINQIVLSESSELIRQDFASASVPIVDFVQAGNWRACVDVDECQFIYAELPTKGYGKKVYGLRVEGESMNLKFPKGFVLSVVNLMDYNPDLQSGDYVIVERVHKGGDHEYTVKRLDIIDGQARLCCESNHPEYEGQCIDIHWPYEGGENIGLHTVQIKAVVLAATTLLEK